MDPRLARLSEPHVRPLMVLIEGLRARGLEVPNVDPDDGGQKARVLFFLETPGPRAVESYFVSRCNEDQSAKNMRRALDDAKLSRGDVLLWNVVPHCISTIGKNRNATKAQVREAIPDTQAFIDTLPNLRVVVFCGRKAQQAMKYLRLPLGGVALCTYHPGSQSYSHHREEIHETFRAASRLLGLTREETLSPETPGSSSQRPLG
jgi:uracil-DNA glycosylase